MTEKDKKRCIIVGAGEFAAAEFEKEKGGLLIAADGGIDALLAMGKAPDIFIGDFDSVKDTVLSRIPGCEILRLPKEKDDTDTVAAIKVGIERGCADFALYGGVGGRLDHTLANIEILAYLASRGLRGTLYGIDFSVTALRNGAVTFPADQRGGLSVFSHSDRSVGVTISGLKYSLTDATLQSDFPLGVSNEFTGKESSVSVRDGTLILLHRYTMD